MTIVLEHLSAHDVAFNSHLSCLLSIVNLPPGLRPVSIPHAVENTLLRMSGEEKSSSGMARLLILNVQWSSSVVHGDGNTRFMCDVPLSAPSSIFRAKRVRFTEAAILNVSFVSRVAITSMSGPWVYLMAQTDLTVYKEEYVHDHDVWGKIPPRPQDPELT